MATMTKKAVDLDYVRRLLAEAGEGLRDPSRTISNSTMAEELSDAVGASGTKERRPKNRGFLGFVGRLLKGS